MASSPATRLSRFLAELKRRHVYRVTAIYVVLAVAGLELASVLLPTTRLPSWFDELFLGVVITGLPLVLVLAWTFDITDRGIRRTSDAEDGHPFPHGSPPQDEATGSDVVAKPALDPLAVAVLPFENLSAVESAEPFALGLHDDLLTELSKASALTVISRTSVRAYAGSTMSLPEIARELGAGTIVEGGVQQAGDRVRLNVQLIDARTDRHLWAQRYDRELTAQNIFDLQSELAAGIMAELRAKLTQEEEALSETAPTSDLEAYRLLVTGREALIDRSEEGFKTAAALAQRAIDRDPEYALAWAALADALVGLVDYGHSHSAEVLQRGGEACRKALALAPNLAEAHAAWGRFRTAIRDAPGSVRAHTRAIELQPGYAGAYQWSCWANLLLCRGLEALALGEKATRLDPLDPEASGNLAMACLMVGDPERALSETRRALSYRPQFEYALWLQGLCLQELERWNEAATSLSRLTDRWTWGWPEVGQASQAAANGNEVGVRRALGSLSGEATEFERGMIHALLGEVDQAFEHMRSEWPLPWAETLYLYVHRGPTLEGLRADERFDPFVEEVRRSWQAETD